MLPHLAFFFSSNLNNSTLMNARNRHDMITRILATLTSCHLPFPYPPSTIFAIVIPSWLHSGTCKCQRIATSTALCLPFPSSANRHWRNCHQSNASNAFSRPRGRSRRSGVSSCGCKCGCKCLMRICKSHRQWAGRRVPPVKRLCHGSLVSLLLLTRLLAPHP